MIIINILIAIIIIINIIIIPVSITITIIIIVILIIGAAGRGLPRFGRVPSQPLALCVLAADQWGQH